MPNKVIYSSVFVRKAKILKKKHPSLTSDLAALEKSLIANPKQGINLGANLYKIRLSIKSKSKGESGGYRIITYLVNDLADNLNINMLTLYDKSEESTIDKKYLLKLLGDID